MAVSTIGSGEADGWVTSGTASILTNSHLNDMVAVHSAEASTFDSLVMEPRGELVVVDFWGPGCPNCDIFAAAVPTLLPRLSGLAVRIVKVNAYEHEELARRFGLFGIPTFLLIRDGKVLGRMSAFHGAEYWLSVVREHAPAETRHDAPHEGNGAANVGTESTARAP